METLTVNDELIKKTEIKDTPFTIVEIEGEFFATMGNYRMTEKYSTFEEAYDAIMANTWNNVTNLIIVLTEILKNSNR
jgi:hypothetical protein